MAFSTYDLTIDRNRCRFATVQILKTYPTSVSVFFFNNSVINTQLSNLSLSLSLSLSLHFNGHFPGDPGLAGVSWSKRWWRWWWQLDWTTQL